MPAAQNVDSKSASHQYGSNSTSNANNINGGSVRNVHPYQHQHQQHHHRPQQSAHQQHIRRPPGQPTTGVILTGAQTTMTGNAHQGTAQDHNNNVNAVNSYPRMPSSTSHPTPLFERLVTEEVQELKAYARIIENQNRRLVELERVHGDLEARLELEARRRAQLETTLEARERDWAARYHDLKRDRDHWKEEVTKEQSKNARLIDQVVRKDQDIHRMLQRKVRFTRWRGKMFASSLGT
jgi:hypothetical protein